MTPIYAGNYLFFARTNLSFSVSMHMESMLISTVSVFAMQYKVPFYWHQQIGQVIRNMKKSEFLNFVD